MSKDLPKLFNRFDGEGQHQLTLDINMLQSDIARSIGVTVLSLLIYSMVLLTAKPPLDVPGTCHPKR